jgi:arylformamidase
MKSVLAMAFGAILLSACATDGGGVPMPSEVIDLGAVVTEDLPERMFGNRWLNEYGFTRPNAFDVVSWSSGPVSGSDAYYTLFNHGGPHVDAPNHLNLGGGIDTYSIDAFVGPLRVFDTSNYANGRTIPAAFFQGQDIREGDVVLIYTSYEPPQTDDELPESVTLTRAAAEYLASIPIRAFATDSYSAGSRDPNPVEADTEIARAAPVHEAFLSRGIPIYEQLFNVETLLGRENMFFNGVPLNIENGDGMIVRPVVFVY